jgi:ATP-dependent protease ClpP protease subunit
MTSSITNVLTAQEAPLPIQVEVNNSTAVTKLLNDGYRYRIKHTGLAYDMSTGATGTVYFTTNTQGGTPATVTASSTGAAGRGVLIIQANNPDLATVCIGPGVSAISFLSSAGSPVVQIEPQLPTSY